MNFHLLKRIEIKALERKIPILQKSTLDFLCFLIKKFQPKKILEVGSAVGYSTAFLSYAAGTNSQVYSIELDPQRAEEAKNNISALGLDRKVRIIEGDALNIIPSMEERFDFVFLDGPKGQYPKLFALCNEKLKEKGLIAADNVLFHGLIQGEVEVPKRLKTIVKRLKEYNNLINSHPQYTSAIVSIGDGLALSYKFKEEN